MVPKRIFSSLSILKSSSSFTPSSVLFVASQRRRLGPAYFSSSSFFLSVPRHQSILITARFPSLRSHPSSIATPLSIRTFVSSSSTSTSTTATRTPVPTLNPSSPKTKSTFTLYSELSKLRLSSLVVLTSGAGFLLAGSPINWSLCFITVIGTSLAAASANTFNQYYERHTDSLMKRTQTRPLPMGTLSPTQALTFGTGMMALSTAILYYGTNPVTTALGVGNILLYAAIYTPLKQKTTYNTAIGAIVGAIPPLMGWTAATGGTLLSVDPLLLATILTTWQFPHFYALAWTLRKDYARGGYQMVPVLDTTEGKYTAWLSLRATFILSLIPTLATIFDVTNPMFAVEGLVLNSYFLYLAAQFYRTPNDLTARALFRTSLWYLPVLILLMVFHSTSWAQQTSTVPESTVTMTTDIPRGQSYGNTIEAIVRWLRYIGKTLCIHEIYIEQMNTMVSTSLKQVLGILSIPSPSTSSSTTAVAASSTVESSSVSASEQDTLSKSAESLARLQTRKMCPVTVIEETTSATLGSATTTTTINAARNGQPSVSSSSG